MPLLLRKIRKDVWIRLQAAWLGPNDTQADVLCNLKTESNSLSVWHVEDDRSNFGRVVAAFVSTWKRVDEFEYALLPWQEVQGLGIAVRQMQGISADEEANRRWHFDLAELTAIKLAHLATVVMNSYKDRLLPKKVSELLAAGVHADRIRKQDLKPSLVESVSQWYSL